MTYWRIRFRNSRIQNSDARLVFQERKFCHITPSLRAPPPNFYTFEVPSPPLPHFYCFPSNTTFTTFHCSPLPPNLHKHSHTHYQHIAIVFHQPPPPQLFSLHHHLHHISFVFPAPPHPPPPQFYCFPSTTSTHVFLLFTLHYLHHHHHLISIVFHPQPPTHFYGFSCATFTTFLLFPCTTTSTTFLLFSIHRPRPPFCCFPSSTLTTLLWFFLHHLHHISIVFLFPLHQYQISKLPPPEPPPSNFYVFFISMLTHQNEEKNRFGQRRARECENREKESFMMKVRKKNQE